MKNKTNAGLWPETRSTKFEIRNMAALSKFFVKNKANFGRGILGVSSGNIKDCSGFSVAGG